MTREAIYAALFTLGQSIQFTPAGGSPQSWAFTARRVYLFNQLPQKPAFCQAEQSEATKPRTNMPAIRTWSATWLFFYDVAQDDVAPGQTANAILDQVDALMPTFEEADQPAFGDIQQTLGGLVHRVAVSGSTKKFLGDITGTALLVVPLVLLVP